MATLYIAEYGALANLPSGGAQIPDEATLLAEQTIGISGVSAQSAVLNPGTKFVRLICDAVCSVKFGYGTAGTPPTPVATTANQRFAAGETEYKGVPTNGNGSGPAQTQVKIAVIANT
jgi:hypothetical protein